MAIATRELTHHEHCCPAAHPAPRPDLRVVPPLVRRGRRRARAQVYARRRAVVAVIAVGVMVAGAAVITGPVLGAPQSAAAAAPVEAVGSVAPGSAPVVVAQGETVWDLVVPHLPAGTDAQAYVAAVLELNGLEATAVAPGTVLRLP
jgi:hypothetical protein